MSVTVEQLFTAGWTVEPTEMYDEEGVDAWLWTSPKGDEHLGPEPPEVEL